MPLKKENDNGETIIYKLKLVDNQILLITYLEFIIKNAKNVWKEKKIGQIENLFNLKMLD